MKKPRILFIDIETSPNLVYSWGIGRKVFLSHENIVKERQIICICWKWNDQKIVNEVNWGFDKDDHSILLKIQSIINSADIIVGHNSDRYDVRFINSRLLYWDMQPVYYESTEDTLKQSKKVFYLNSYKLDYISEFCGFGKKIPTTFDLWKKVMKGDIKALKEMITYCKNDVILTEKIYNRMSNSVVQKVHKGLAMGHGKLSCSACGLDSLKPKGFRYNPKSVKHKYVCGQCGKWMSL